MVVMLVPRAAANTCGFCRGPLRGHADFLGEGGNHMTKYLLAAAALAAIGFAGAAYAGDAAPKPMSDSEMDKVTAAGRPTNTGNGIVTSACAGGHKGAVDCGTL